MTITGVTSTPLSIIDTKGGAVLHAIKRSDYGFSGFGEAYFSMVEFGAIKAWKRHQKMILNLIVPIGQVRFVIYDDRENSLSKGMYQEVTLSLDNYFRLTVPPMLWIGFQGLDENISMLLNIADIEHTLEEADRKEIHEIKYDWGLGT